MKCRIPSRNILNKQQRQACVDYVQEKAEENTNRLFKLFCYCLNTEFRFGADRLSRLISAVEELSEKHTTDEVFWEHIDRDLHKIGVYFKDEEYEDILSSWKSEVK